jgi:hypothetical protein
MYAIETRTIERQTVASIEERVLAPDLPAFIDRATDAILETLTSGGVAIGTPFVAYHGEVNLDADGPVELCVPYEGMVEPAGSIRTRIEPSHEEAFARITKAEVDFPKILAAYEAVDRWVSDRGFRVTGSPREVYFVDWDEAARDDPACDIALLFGAA